MFRPLRASARIAPRRPRPTVPNLGHLEDRTNPAPVLNPANGHYYDVINTSVNWASANTAAQASSHLGLQGHLATITSAAENLFLNSTFGPGALHYHWTGGLQPAGSAEPAGGWTWATGESFIYNNWAAPGEPNNNPAPEDRIIFDHGVGANGKHWNDLNGLTAASGYVVEYEGKILDINGSESNDWVSVTPIGASSNGSTGVRVQSVIGGVWSQTDYAGPISSGDFDMLGGDDNVQIAASLTFPAVALMGSGNNYLTSGGGNDYVTAGTGNDNLNTGAGDDTVTDAGGNNYVHLGDGTNGATTGAGDDQVRGGSGNDTINAGDGNNGVDAGDGTNSITTGSGNDWVQGGNGTDTINAGNGSNTVIALGGNDSVTTGTGGDYVNGGEGNDTINTDGGDDRVEAGGGNDNVDLGTGNDYASGGGGDDVLVAGDGFDNVEGGDGSDLLVGGLGGDQMSGGNSNDVLFAQGLAGAGSSLAGLRTKLDAWIAGGYTAFDATGLTQVMDASPMYDNVRGDGGTDLFSGKDGSDYFDQIAGEGTIVLP